ncbi:MAG: hypothetical protein U1D55_08510 [Phycisphaerae bacterium]
MNKPLLGLVLGAVLGLLDGASSWIDAQSDAEVRAGYAGIVMGSTVKGLLGGVVTGLYARRSKSATSVIVVGVLIGAALAFLVAALQDKYYLRITLPGAILGAIVGYATQRYGARPASLV